MKITEMVTGQVFVILLLTLQHTWLIHLPGGYTAPNSCYDLVGLFTERIQNQKIIHINDLT